MPRVLYYKPHPTNVPTNQVSRSGRIQHGSLQQQELVKARKQKEFAQTTGISSD